MALVTVAPSVRHFVVSPGLVLLCAVMLSAGACGTSNTPDATIDVLDDATIPDTVDDGMGGDTIDGDTLDGDVIIGDTINTDVPLPDGIERPVEDPEAAGRAFRLYYRERVERTIIAFNRFMVFGDTTFGINIRKAGISRQGDTFEVIPGPNDNNSIGSSARATWYAYRIFHSRPLALTLVRMFDGLAFIATMTGHDGVTGRNAYPNWTLDLDGDADTVARTRAGTPITPPSPPDPALEAEIMATLFDGVHITYRGEPEDILLNYMPAQEVGPYAVTYGFSMLPPYLRISDCCTSMMQVPQGYTWEGAFWSNHNSRDNFPDLAFGYVAALEAMNDPEADPDVRAAAARAWQAGQMVGDSVQDNGSRIMTVSEFEAYDQLIPSGEVRPDGSTEAEDLGSMSDCQMTFLARALSSDGLALPLPELPKPGAMDNLVSPYLDPWSGCPPEGTTLTCTSLAEAICGKNWSGLNELTIDNKGLLDVVREAEDSSPGSANMVLGGFYGNYDQPVNALLGLCEYARVTGNSALLAEATAAMQQMTDLSRTFADLIYGNISPETQAHKRYLTALIDGQAGLVPSATDLGDFAPAEQQMSRLEGVLDLQDTPAAVLLTDEQIAQQVHDTLSGKSSQVQTRYTNAWGTTPPLRRTAEGYEARIYGPDGPGDWHAVDNPHHLVFGGIELLEALPLCITSPGTLDCTWARLGCARPDLNADGTVDTTDVDLFQQASLLTSANCDDENEWCGGADLDHTGLVDETDTAFMEAAQGCHYTVAGQ